jgi:hypothetical protein
MLTRMKTNPSFFPAVACLAFSSILFAALMISADANARTTVDVNLNIGAPFINSLGYIGVGYRAGRNAYRYPNSAYSVNQSYRRGWVGPRVSLGWYLPIIPYSIVTQDAYSFSDSTVVCPASRRSESIADSLISPASPSPVVAAPPAPLDTNQPVPTYEQPDRAGQLFAYPRKGQSETSATFDRIECETVGTKKTGYYPGQSLEIDKQKNDYRDAVVSCLEGRGYTVK